KKRNAKEHPGCLIQEKFAPNIKRKKRSSTASSHLEPIIGFSLACLCAPMKHFAVYHNPERMGYSADEVSELCIVTNKSVDMNSRDFQDARQFEFKVRFDF